MLATNTITCRSAQQIRIMKQILLLLIVTFLVFESIYAEHTYYFSSKATGEGKGTIQQPFTSLQKLAQLTLQAGDTIFLHAGEEFTVNLSLSNISGTIEHHIVFTSYGKGRCTINGSNKEAFIISGSAYFQIMHLTLTGAGRKTGNTSNGLKLVNCKNAMVEDMEISGFQKSGLLLYNCEKIEVSDVLAHGNGFAGILLEGDYQKRISNNIHIINCKAYNNPGDPTALDNHSGNGILAGNCRNVLIEYCTATNNGWDMPRVGNGPVGIWAYEADSVVIQHCISYRNKTAKGAADGGGFDLDGGVTNSIIQYCLSYENWGSGYGIYQYNSASKWYNNTVRYCISINDGNVTDLASAMLIWNGWNGGSTFTDFYAYNNFFYNDRKYAFGFHPQSQHRKFSFFNNVFIAADTSDIFNGIDSSLNDTFSGNVWMHKSGSFKQNNFTGLAAWAAATGYEQMNGKLTGTSFPHPLFDIPSNIDITNPHLLDKDPLLLTLCNSALRSKGIDIRKMFSINTGTRDFFGHSILLGESVEPGVCESK
jgi:hypothetical protein